MFFCPADILGGAARMGQDGTNYRDENSVTSTMPSHTISYLHPPSLLLL
jgi:hypothetical protein